MPDTPRASAPYRAEIATEQPAWQESVSAVLRVAGIDDGITVEGQAMSTYPPVRPRELQPVPVAVCGAGAGVTMAPFEMLLPGPGSVQRPGVSLFTLRSRITWGAPPPADYGQESGAAKKPDFSLTMLSIPAAVLQAAAEQAAAARSKPTIAAGERPPEPAVEPAQKPKSTVQRKTTSGLRPAPVPDPADKARRGADLQAPTWSGTVPAATFLERVPLWAKAAAVVVLLAGIGGWFARTQAGKSKTPQGPLVSSTPAASIALGSSGWNLEWAADEEGVRRGRQFRLYTPSSRMLDYTYEFSALIESKSVGWVYRLADPKNYYAMKVETQRNGGQWSARLVRFAVIDGIETAKSAKDLPITVRPDTVYRIRMEVRGQKFQVSVQGKLADSWSDARLPAGALGFLTERGERAQVQSVQLSL